MIDDQVAVTNRCKAQQCIIIDGRKCPYGKAVTIASKAWEGFKNTKAGSFYATQFDVELISKKKTHGKKT